MNTLRYVELTDFSFLATGPPQRDQVPGLLHPGQRVEHRPGAGGRRGSLAHDQTLQTTEAPDSGANDLEVLRSALLCPRAYA